MIRLVYMTRHDLQRSVFLFFSFPFSGGSHRCRGCTGARLRDGNLSSHNNIMSDSEQPKEEKPDNTHINLKVSDGSAEIFFKIKRTTPMRRLMEAFCKRQGKSMDTIRFLIDGARVGPDNTPDLLELEDGDVIEAHREQVGGNI